MQSYKGILRRVDCKSRYTLYLFQKVDLFEMKDKNVGYKSLLEQGRDFASLKIEGWRLLAVDKATEMLSTIVFVVIASILGVCIMLFLSVALVHLLADFMPIMWAYLVVGGCYAMALIIVTALRRRLIVDSVARFLSKLFLEQPESSGDETSE